MKTKRTIFEILRHAEPVVDLDPKSKNYNRSTNVITTEGLIKSVNWGFNYRNHKGNLEIYSTPEPRGQQTAAGINVGIGKQADIYAIDDRLGLGVFKGKKMPKGIPYGEEFIDYIIKENPGIEKEIFSEISDFIDSRYSNINKDLIVGVSHGPKVEITAGVLMGWHASLIGALAAEPLEGFELIIEAKEKSGTIDEIIMNYGIFQNKRINKEILVYR